MHGLDAAPAKIEPQVWPEQWDAWRIFMGMSTQWTFAGQMLLRTGLRYEGLRTVAECLDISWPLPPRVFADIRLCEAEALSAWSKRNSGA
jgi:hypothetical protein